MVCTYTNVAVDNLVEGFVKAGLDPVRIGYGQIKSGLREHLFEFKLEQHPLYLKYKVTLENLESLEKDLKQTNARIFERQKQGGSSGELSRLKSHRDAACAKRSRLDSEKLALYRQMQTEILANADVVRVSLFHTFSRLMCTPRCAPPASLLGLSH